MAKLDTFIETGVTTLTTATIIVVIVQAYLSERRDRRRELANRETGEICPHCGQTIETRSAASETPLENHAGTDSSKVIRPAAWSVRDETKIPPVSGWRLGLSALKRAVGGARSERE